MCGSGPPPIVETVLEAHLAADGTREEVDYTLVVVHVVRPPEVSIGDLAHLRADRDPQAGLLRDLARGGLLGRLPQLHVTLRKAPDSLVRLPKQEHAALRVEHHAARPTTKPRRL